MLFQHPVLQTLVALGEQGNLDARRPDDEYLPGAGAIVKWRYLSTR